MKRKPVDHETFHDFVRTEGVQLTMISPEEYRRSAVTHVTDDAIYAKNLPVSHGINDPRMGTMDRRIECTTCINDNKDCPGHHGRIELPAPMYFIGFIAKTYSLLRAICPFCARLKVDEHDFKAACIIEDKDEMFSKSDKTFTQITNFAKTKKDCKHCGMPQPDYSQTGPNINWSWKPEAALLLANMGVWSSYGRPFNAADALSILRAVPDTDYEMLGLDPKNSHPSWAIMTVMCVVPPAVRPAIMASEGSKTRGQDDLTWILKRIVKTIQEIKAAMKEKGLLTSQNYSLKMFQDVPVPKPKKKRRRKKDVQEEEVVEKHPTKVEFEKKNVKSWASIWKESANVQLFDEVLEADGDMVAVMWDRMPKLMEKLQRFVTAFVNNDQKYVNQMQQRSGTPMKTLVGRLNAKSGRIRGNLMGKRVDFSGRSVISPGADMDVDELGISWQIAAVLTVPERVNSYNIKRLSEMIKRGPHKMGGANRILCTDGRVIYLEFLEERSSIQLQERWVVERHLIDGDDILFNRQPSLHRMSFMRHRAKVLKEDKTFQLHLCCTSPYNADFDGDEMNAHSLQNIHANGEARHLMAVEKHIISPQGNRPIIHLVQNALLSSYLLSCKESFFGIDKVCQFICLLKYPKPNLKIHVIPEPAILKPKRLWTGKQIYSFLFPETLNMSMSVGEQEEGKPFDHEKRILIRNGELLTGRICKKAVGSSPNNIVDVLARDHGSKNAVRFLSDACRILDYYMSFRGFSIGVDDCLLEKETETKVHVIMEEVEQVQYILDEFKGVEAHMSSEEKTQVETKVQSMLAKIVETAARHAAAENSRRSASNENSMVSMIASGAKGKPDNITKMSVAIGQQIVEGVRPEHDPHGRTLPCFAAWSNKPEGRGFVPESYIHGLGPATNFCHYMGGREGLVDTAVKTADTGYIQRQLVKAMEAMILNLSGAVMEENKIVVEFLYGGDGMDPMHVERCRFPWIWYSNEMMKSLARGHRKWLRMLMRTRQTAREHFMTLLEPEPPGSIFLPANVERLVQDNLGGRRPPSDKLLDKDVVFERLRQVCMWMRNHVGHAATVGMRFSLICEMSPSNLYKAGVTTEEALGVLDEVRLRFRKGLAQPGEMVGILAAQSVGEPTTQLTLNTFHLAGAGSKQLTQGVPRFQEIISMSPSPSTPYMSLAIFENSEKMAKKVAKSITCIPLISVSRDPFIVRDPVTKSGPLTSVKTHLPAMMLAEEIYGREYIQIEKDVFEPSPFVVCLELKKSVMEEKELTPLMVAKAIENGLSSTPMTIIYSEVNMDLWVVRIRLWNQDDEGKVRDFPSLLAKLTLGGIKGINYAEAARTKMPKVNSETGEIELVEEWRVDVQGSGLLACAANPRIDWNRSYTNHILEVCAVLGIDACRKVIMHELYKVLTFDGGYVDRRHISLLAEALTFRGATMATSRHGQNRVDKGPLIRCSFEETAEMLHHAAYFAETDSMGGLTQNLMLGQPAPMGTAAFGVQKRETGSLHSMASQHSLLSKLNEKKPSRASRVDKETGLVYGSHHSVPKHNPEEDPNKPARVARIRQKEDEGEEVYQDFDSMMDTLKNRSKKGKVHFAPEAPSYSSQRHLEGGAYGGLVTVEDMPVDDSLFKEGDLAIIKPLDFGDGSKVSKDKRSLRLQKYRDYLESKRNIGLEQHDGSDIQIPSLNLGTSLAPTEVGPNDFPTEEESLRASRSAQIEEDVNDALGCRLDLDILAGFNFASKVESKPFRPSTPELDLLSVE